MTYARKYLYLIVITALVGFLYCGGAEEPQPQTEARPEQEQPAPTTQAEPRAEPEEAEPQEPESTTQVQPEPAPDPMGTPESETARHQPAETSRVTETAEAQDITFFEDTVWAAGHEGMLMRGLDGGLYEPYEKAIVKDVQQKLQNQGYYDGPVTGVLNRTTMEAIGQFQKDHQIQASGVPSPSTRAELDLGEALRRDQPT